MITTTRQTWMPSQRRRQNDIFFLTGAAGRSGFGVLAWRDDGTKPAGSPVAEATRCARAERGSMRLATSAYTTTRRFPRRKNITSGKGATPGYFGREF